MLPLHSTVKDRCGLRREKPVRVHPARAGGDDRDRTGDLRLAKPALSRLSYIPGAARATPARFQNGGPE